MAEVTLVQSDQSGTMTPIAILGDSDSHSYQDRITFVPGSPERGGPYRANTLQWTEVLHQLRGQEIDLGPWGVWGTRGALARVQRWFGVVARAPKKEDFLYNLSYSGAVCEDLSIGPARQVPPLLALIEAEPDKWRRGIVIIRIGTNSFGRTNSLSKLARDPSAPEVQSTIRACERQIRAAVDLIREAQPAMRFVLVGIFDNAHWPKNFCRWQSAQELQNISAGLDQFDRALRSMAEEDSKVAFFDDRAWFNKLWGARDAQGRPGYRSVRVADVLEVTNTAGDGPEHAVLCDGHAGLAWNFLWAQSMVDLIRQRFGVPVNRIRTIEFRGILRPRRDARSALAARLTDVPPSSFDA